MDCKGVAPAGFWFRKEGSGILLTAQLPKITFTETKEPGRQLFEKQQQPVCYLAVLLYSSPVQHELPFWLSMKQAEGTNS